LLACGIEIGLLSIFDAYTVEQKKQALKSDIHG
jgi:hypothetical protein